MTGQEAIKQYLNKLGYVVNDKAFKKIEIANDWYKDKQLPFHKRTTINGVDYELERTNFTKRLCSDDANLCETVEIIAQKSETDNKLILDALKDNNFNVMYRKQLEEMSATGTVGCYLRVKDAKLLSNGTLKGGKLHLNYAEASNIVILKCDNNVITECAFMGDSYDVKGSKTCINVFRLVNDKYECRTAYFDENNRLLNESKINLGEVKPFAIMRVAEVNNIEDMKGYGLPKIFNVVAELMILDLTYNMWLRDLDKSDKLVFINKDLCKYNEATKQYELPNDEMKKIFVAMTDDNDAENSKYQEYNPSVRIGEVLSSLELVLSMLSLRFGFGTKKYRFEQGRIVTATEYIGERQDAMQELNKQRQESKQYIEDIIKFVRWYEQTFNSKTLADDEIEIKFDDSYVTDKEKEMLMMRDDALGFNIPQLKRQYLQQKYGLTDDEADEWMKASMGIMGDGTQLEE